MAGREKRRKRKNVVWDKELSGVVVAPHLDWENMHCRPHHIARAMSRYTNVFYVLPRSSNPNVPQLERVSDRLFLVHSDWESLLGSRVCLLMFNTRYVHLARRSAVTVFDVDPRHCMCDESDILFTAKASDLVTYPVIRPPVDGMAVRIPNGAWGMPEDCGTLNDNVIKAIRQRGVTGPIVLYAGLLGGDVIDMDLLLSTIRNCEGVTFVVAGHAYPSDNARAVMDAGGIYLGQLRYMDTLMLMYVADLGIVPYKVNSFTRSIDPLKQLEMAAVGTPVVSTVAPANDRHLCRKGGPIKVVSRDEFPSAVLYHSNLAINTVMSSKGTVSPYKVTQWDDVATLLVEAISDARGRREASCRGSGKE